VRPASGLTSASSTAVSRAEQRPVSALRGVGAALAERLARLNVTRVADLLFVLPLRYEDRTHVAAIGALTPGARAAVEGEIQLTEVAYRGRRQLLCRISDGSGMLTLRFFYFSASQQANLARGTRLRCFAEVRRGPLGLEMVHPEYRRLTAVAAPLEETLTPIYPLTEGVPQGRLRALIAEALRELERAPLRDFIPPEAGLPAGLPSLPEALNYLHRPPRAAQLAELAAGRHPAQQRLAFEELLAHHLALRLRKRTLKSDPAFALTDAAHLGERFLAALPFRLTRAQARARGCRARSSRRCTSPTTRSSCRRRKSPRSTMTPSSSRRTRTASSTSTATATSAAATSTTCRWASSARSRCAST
jgi:ATP-dependent DNA helicase RecG